MIGRNLPRQRPGKPIRAETINAFQRLLEGLSRGQQLAGFGLGLDRRRAFRARGFYARLSGSSSPYSYAEVYAKITGGALTWVTMPHGRTGTSNAYEDNDVAGLGGNVVEIQPAIGAADVFRFQFHRKDFRCDTSTTYISFQVDSSCTHGPLTDATVTVTDSDGVVVGSGSPDETGLYVLGITKPGNYSYSVSRDRYQTQLGVVEISACGTTASVTAELGPQAGYACCNGYLYAKTLFLTTDKGTFTLVYGVVGFVPGWRVTPSITLTGYPSSANCLGFGGQPTCCVDCASGPSTVTVPVGLGLSCAGLEETWNVPDHCVDFAGQMSCLPMVVGACTGAPAVAATDLAGWPVLGGALPQTFILPDASNGGCASPIFGNAILSE